MFNSSMNALENETLYWSISEQLFSKHFKLVCFGLRSVWVVYSFESLSNPVLILSPRMAKLDFCLKAGKIEFIWWEEIFSFAKLLSVSF
jgi:hypothetical protein